MNKNYEMIVYHNVGQILTNLMFPIPELDLSNEP